MVALGLRLGEGRDSMEARTVFTGSVVRAAVEALREVGVAPALLELAGPSHETRIDEALARATGLEGEALRDLREALVAVGDHAADVERVQALSPLDDARGAIAVGARRYRIERLGDAPAPSRKKRKERKEPKSRPALVTIVRAGERARSAKSESPPPDPPAPVEAPPEEPARRQLPAGRGRFTSAGRLEGGGAPGTAAWSRPLSEPPRAARPRPAGAGGRPKGSGRPGSGRRHPRGGR